MTNKFIKNIIVFSIVFFFCLVVSFATNRRYATLDKQNNNVVIDYLNWDSFYDELKGYLNVYGNSALLFIWEENKDSPCGKDMLDVSTTPGGPRFYFYSKSYRRALVFAVYIGAVYAVDVPYGARPFDTKKGAIKYWNELMDKYNGVQYEE